MRVQFMEVTNVRVEKLTVDLPEPNKLSMDRSVEGRAAAIVVVETDVGIRGIGEAIGPHPDPIETLVEEKYGPRLIGENPLDRERNWQDMVVTDVYRDQKGQAVCAASGIDMALWDIAGKYYKAPVYKLLGGRADDGPLRAYASDLFWDSPNAMAEAAAEYVESGFPAVKSHLGRGLVADRERVKAIQNAIGDAALMVDVNCGYDRTTALQVGRMLEEHNVYWYEEPIAPHDIDGHVELAQKLDIPIAVGENEYTKWGFKPLFERGAIDIAMPDIMRSGGVTEVWKICALAEAHNTVCSLHNFSTGVGLAATIQLTAASPACEWIEWDVTGFELIEPMLAHSIQIDDRGYVEIPDEPGLGGALPDHILSEYGV